MADGGNINWSDVCELVEFFAQKRYDLDISEQPITLSSFQDKKIKVISLILYIDM